jgi:hypothetical protein
VSAAADPVQPQPRRLVGLRVADPPEVWATLGFHVADDRVVVGGVVIELTTEEADGVRGWRFDPPWDASIDGLASIDGSGQVPAPAAHDGHGSAAHPNAATALDHLVVATPDVERTTTALGTAGIEPRRTIEGARGDRGVLYRFFLLGTCVLELVGPRTPDGDGPARFVGLAFTTTAIDELGTVAGEPRPAIQPGRRIATVRRQVGSTVPIAFLSPRT